MDLLTTALISAFSAAASALAAGRAEALAAAGLPSGLAYLALPLLQQLKAHDDQDEVADRLRELVGTEHRRALRRALESDLGTALRALEGESPLGLACKALLEALADPQSRPSLGVQMRIEASEHSTAQNIRQVVVQPGGSYAEAPPDPARERRERALLDYLRALQNECSPLQLSRIDAAEARYQRPMRLEQVYIRLDTQSQVELTGEERQQLARERPLRGDERPTRPLTALEALARAEPPRLMLLGAPGSGKSTFVNHLVLCLAGAALVERWPGEQPPAESWLVRMPGWSRGALVPLRVILRDFAAFVPLARAKKGTCGLLRAFLKETYGADATERLVEDLSDGRAILLFDGLDEVVGEAALARVAETIAAAAGTYARSPILVTCRVLDYQANPRRQLRGFGVETLAQLSDEQIDRFVVAWYDELTATGRQVLGNAAALRQAVATRPELRELARTPLLLTMMAVVHAGKGTLPDARALLYYECIELLLLRWRQEPGQPDVLDQLALPQFRAGDLLALMARLGNAAHEQSERDPQRSEAPAGLSRAQVQQLIGQAFAPYTPGDPIRRDQLVSLLLHAIAARNGLLLKRSGEQDEAYAFPHRTFQEFLAGYHLKNQPDYRKRCLERSAQAHWHEALSLMVGYQVLEDRELERSLDLAEKLLERSPMEQVLAGELLNLIGRERAAGYNAELVQPGGLWARAQATLLDLVSSNAPDASAALRVRAGLALGTLCYGPVALLGRPGAEAPLPDPRLLDPRTGDAPDGRYWCAVGAGPFWYGDDREGELRQITLPYDFKIARYMVTNAEYARFVADGGYDPRQPWWTEQGRAFLAPGGHRFDDQEQPIILPRLWDDARYNSPLQPVTGISWYEAAAYCNWLTVQGHKAGWLAQDAELRLPTSLEWERAARHTDQRRYPWGEAEPDAERASYDASGLNQPSPAGCYPTGAAECGALDLAGNVLEWMATSYDEPQELEPRKDFTPMEEALLSGSAYWRGKEHLCCGARGWGDPYYWINYLGFRVLRSLRARR